ncbi:hypothetical protein NA56DRAFT_244248 [Hyaloscypha hepaticicola]|uniref:Uncharacterized protein n=1 Tax=Hyaloscypha hepaticicola TaxID=2082293 RepID=A0A2J6PWQ7_9HELO|nr:hypothetical protein NA56DRAFT_244248 [Hyaloscypha hepaticicola]
MLCSSYDRIFSIPQKTNMRVPHANHTMYELHSSLRTLQQGAETHCQICRSLWNSMIRDEPPPAFGDGKEDEISS